MIQRLIYLTLILGGLALPGCRQEELPRLPTEPAPEYASMVVTVGLCRPVSDLYCEEVDPVAGALVQLFDSEADREYGEPLLAQKTTSPLGEVTFHQLSGGRYYYLRTISSWGEESSLESTPVKGIAYHEVLFFE